MYNTEKIISDSSDISSTESNKNSALKECDNVKNTESEESNNKWELNKSQCNFSQSISVQNVVNIFMQNIDILCILEFNNLIL